VINMTPDSVSGDGLGTDVARAVAQGRRLVEAGANVLDVGGESTRPGATPVDAEEELRRVVPAIEALAAELPVPISVDTTKGVVADAGLRAGACIVNDVSGLHVDPSLAIAVAQRDAVLILGHWVRREWGTGIPAGGDPVTAVCAHLTASAARARDAGVARAAIWLDPGLGFGKRAATSLAIVRGLERIVAMGYPVAVGPSRKAFIGDVLHVPAAEDWEGAATLVTLAIAGGAQIARVHDVHRLARVVRMADAMLAKRPIASVGISS
jgi:dihydropteroate synthase